MSGPQRLNKIWPIAMFGIATVFYLYEFLLRVSPNVLQRELFTAFAMDAGSFGFFSSCWFWAYAPLQLPVGAMTDKYGPRRLLTIAILLCAGSTLVLAYTGNFTIACLARFCIGAGSAFAFISCLKIANIWFNPQLFPIMTGLTLMIGTLGAAVGGTPLAIALNYFSWRELLYYLGLFGLVLGLFAYALIRDRNPEHPDEKVENHQQPGLRQCLKQVIKQPQNWIVGLYAFFITAPTDAFGGAWGIKYLVDVHHISRDEASVAAVTMTFIGMAIGSPFLGWISTVLDNRKATMMVSSIIACIALTVIVYYPTLTPMTASIWFFIFGTFGTYVLAFVMIRRFTGSIYVATAVGFVNMLSNLGSAILTYTIGELLDLSRTSTLSADGNMIYSVQDYQFSLFLLPLFYAMSAFLVVPFLRDKKTT